VITVEGNATMSSSAIMAAGCGTRYVSWRLESCSSPVQCWAGPVGSNAPAVASRLGDLAGEIAESGAELGHLSLIRGVGVVRFAEQLVDGRLMSHAHVYLRCSAMYPAGISHGDVATSGATLRAPGTKPRAQRLVSARGVIPRGGAASLTATSISPEYAV
jgi:hypothetical protein